MKQKINIFILKNDNNNMVYRISKTGYSGIMSINKLIEEGLPYKRADRQPH